jgi:hypothetical protein
MAKKKESDLKERLKKYCVDRPGRRSQFQFGLWSMRKSFTCSPCRVPILSGTATFLRTQRFGLTTEARRRSSEPFQSGNRTPSNRWLKSSGKSMEQNDVKRYYSEFDVAVLAKPA